MAPVLYKNISTEFFFWLKMKRIETGNNVSEMKEGTKETMMK